LVRELQLPAFGTDGPGAAAPCYGLPTVDPDSGLAAPGYPAFFDGGSGAAAPCLFTGG
jgi:hypothetical protein